MYRLVLASTVEISLIEQWLMMLVFDEVGDFVWESRRLEHQPQISGIVAARAAVEWKTLGPLNRCSDVVMWSKPSVRPAGRSGP